MTSVIEKLVAIIAPHQCLMCSIEYNIVCEACALQLMGTAESACAGCGISTPDFSTCDKCLASMPIEHVWVGGAYEGALEAIIKRFKFERAQAAAEPLARALAAELPVMSPQTVLVPLPTAPSRVRQRGYDQAAKLAQALGKELGLPTRLLLARAHDLRQLGASRSKRYEQAAKAFYVPNRTSCKDMDILLVDDVITTGASLAAAAKQLRAIGARSVRAVVIAKQAARK